MAINESNANQSNAGRHDHDRVAAGEDEEVAQLMAKHKKSRAQVLLAIKKAGPMRVEIERALRK